MSFLVKNLVIPAVLCGLFVDAAVGAGNLSPDSVRCEYRSDPLGIDSAEPRLSWILRPTDPHTRGLAQSAYQVLVASSSERLARNRGDLWDSGRVRTDQMNQVAYAGRSLASSQEVWCKVRIWDQAGEPSDWSPVLRWTMGVLHPADWGGAAWIAAPDAGQPDDHHGPKTSYETVLLRREFNVKPNLRRAVVHVCGLGQYEMTLNGGPVGAEVLAPGWTLYGKTCLYDTCDITPMLRVGANAAGLFLGNGFFNLHGQRYNKLKIQGPFFPVQAKALIRLEYADGSVENVVTDDHWKTASGPITFSSIYGGEDYDDRLVREGWDQPGFNDAAWATPAITSGPGGLLKGLSASAPPIRRFGVLTPVTSQTLAPGVIVHDLGQNAALMLRLKVRGPAGSTVKVTPSELLKSGGDINDTMCKGQSYWVYTLSGRGEENYSSHFYYRGGRYLKVELQPAPGGGDLPVVETIEGDTIHADAPAVGQFSCSSDLFNHIHTLIHWAQLNNLVSVMTDCPTREKLGWLEEDHLNGPALRYNFDVSTLLTKMAGDMADSQRPGGLVPATCPDFLRLGDNNPFCNPPEWGSACIIVPWQQYQFEGDLGLLRAHYDMMKSYVGYLNARAQTNIVNFGLGDWYDNLGFGAAQLTPVALTATAFYCEDARLLSRIAALLGKTDDATHFRQLAEDIQASFDQKFYNAVNNTYATGSQASLATPLALNLVPPSARPVVLEKLVADFKTKQTTVGEVCLEFLLHALAEGGRSDLIYQTYSSQESGYGLQAKLGKTSLTEGWNGGASQDHFMFGELDEWLYAHLAGIQGDPEGPGFKKIIIRPSVVGDLTWARASYDSIQGRIFSEWRRDGANLTLHVTIPPNTTATVYVPAISAAQVTESGAPAAGAAGVKFLNLSDGAASYQVVSGDYTFGSRLPDQ